MEAIPLFFETCIKGPWIRMRVAGPGIAEPSRVSVDLAICLEGLWGLRIQWQIQDFQKGGARPPRWRAKVTTSDPGADPLPSPPTKYILTVTQKKHYLLNIH